MTSRNSYTKNILLALVCAVFLGSNLIAQTSGKVRGTVTDEATGEEPAKDSVSTSELENKKVSNTTEAFDELFNS